MRRYHTNRKGQTAAAVILSGLVFAFVVALLYLILNEPTNTIYQITANSTAGSIGEETVPKIVNYWKLWPIVAIVGIFLAMIIGVLKATTSEPPY